MDPRLLSIKDFSYYLPTEKIAKYPLAERDQSKLLLYHNGKISESIYKNIGEYIPENSLLVFNNSKVIRARLLFKNTTGATIELFCLEPYPPTLDLAKAMATKNKVKWVCLVGKASKWKQKTLSLKLNSIELTTEIIEKTNDTYVIEFSWTPPDLTFAEILDKAGAMPIPPYLKRESEDIDVNRYQTVYAKENGSVAAPTAGLHFTESVFSTLKEKKCEFEYVTLHVGAGTFKPVKSATMQEHTMHAEWIEVDKKLLKKIIDNPSKPIISVGTTSLRTLETLYWMGIKAGNKKGLTIDYLEIKQWDVYELQNNSIPRQQALLNLLNWLEGNNKEKIICKTQILLAPPYKVKVVDALITNFHQPESTLLLLVASVIGKNWKQVYEYALQNNFRFLSYGDGSLLFV